MVYNIIKLKMLNSQQSTYLTKADIKVTYKPFERTGFTLNYWWFLETRLYYREVS